MATGNFAPATEQIALTSVFDGNSFVLFVRNIIYFERIKGSNNCKVFYQDPFVGRLREIVVHVELYRLNSKLWMVNEKMFRLVNRSTVVNLRYVTFYNNDIVALWTPEGKVEIASTNDIGFQFNEV